MDTQSNIMQHDVRPLAALAVILAIPLVISGLVQAPGSRDVDVESVRPKAGVELPIVWGDLGAKLVASGAIDRGKFVTLYGKLSSEQELLLSGNPQGKLRITPENADYLLNLLWALGLANKNPILDEGEMNNPDYGGADGFASTGGWTLSSGDAMEHYSAHALIELTEEEQKLVEKVSGGIYRPCCDNPTSFPDCNHGMAMLGLLELLASQGASEEDMWKAALVVNSYWFPDTYETIAAYEAKRGIAWRDVSPKEVLGYDYSSYSGYQRVLADVQPAGQGGAKCSV